MTFETIYKELLRSDRETSSPGRRALSKVAIAAIAAIAAIVPIAATLFMSSISGCASHTVSQPQNTVSSAGIVKDPEAASGDVKRDEVQQLCLASFQETRANIADHLIAASCESGNADTATLAQSIFESGVLYTGYYRVVTAEAANDFAQSLPEKSALSANSTPADTLQLKRSFALNRVSANEKMQDAVDKGYTKWLGERPVNNCIETRTEELMFRSGARCAASNVHLAKSLYVRTYQSICSKFLSGSNSPHCDSAANEAYTKYLQKRGIKDGL